MAFQAPHSTANTLPANVINFSVAHLGNGTITGINSTSGTLNYIETELPALSIFTINLSLPSGGTLQFLHSLGNTGYDVPTGTGLSYSSTQSYANASGPLSASDNGWAQLYDSTDTFFLGTVYPGYLSSSASIDPSLLSGTATFTNNQTGGPAVLEIDFEGSGTSNSSAPILASYSLTAETPLPAALPLFATGLGALGLLGWRRRRNSVSVK